MNSTKQFLVTAIINLVAGALIIWIVGGNPFTAIGSWSGALIVIGLLVVLTGAYLAFRGLAKGTYTEAESRNVALVVVAVFILIAVVFGLTGLSWITNLLGTITRAIWWPFIAIAASAAITYATRGIKK